MKSDYKTEEFLKKNPVGYLPFLEDGDFALAESAAIAEYGMSSFYLFDLHKSFCGGEEEERVERGDSRICSGGMSKGTHPIFMMIQ